MANNVLPIAKLQFTESSKNSSSDADLASTANTIISAYTSSPSPSNITGLPATLRSLLLTIIRPLFSTTQHPSLAPSGRKAAFPPLPSLPHSSPLKFDSSNHPPWKRHFDTLTSPLLRAILASYEFIAPPKALRGVIEEQIFLLTPAILNLIDDGDVGIKTTGFELLRVLSDVVRQAQSPILHKSGLVEVFVKALESDFMLLPTLTPEDESLEILRALYPALLGLITAEFPQLPATAPTSTEAIIKSGASGKEEAMRQRNLTAVVLNKAIMPSLAHLGAGQATSHPPIVALLLTHFKTTIEVMGIYATPHLQTLLPLLRATIVEPFALAAPEMVLAALDCLDALLYACEVRIKERWWEEVLRALVGGWCAISDELEDVGAADTEITPPSAEHDSKAVKLNQIKQQVRKVAVTLSYVVAAEKPAEWDQARQQLCAEELGLAELFA